MGNAGTKIVRFDRMIRLDQWLSDIDANNLTTARVDVGQNERRSFHQCITPKGTTFVVMVLSVKDKDDGSWCDVGFEVFVPPCNSGRVTEIFEAAQKMLEA